MKKLISLIVVVVMSSGVFSGIAAMADDIIVPSKVIMSHDFTQDTTTPDGWTVSTGAVDEKWGFDNGAYIEQTDKVLKLTSVDSYDAAGSPYTITVNHSLTANSYYTMFAIQSNSKYYVRIHGTSDSNRYVYLHKVENGTDTQVAKSDEIVKPWCDATKNQMAEIKIAVGLENIDVYINDVKMLSYANDYDSTISSGKIEFRSGYNVYKLYSFSIATEATVLQAENTGASLSFDVPAKTLMSHDFTQDTAMPAGWEEYKASDMTGYEFNGGLYITQTNRYLQITSPDEYDAKGKPYTITANHTLTYNGHYIFFAIQENSKYYMKIDGSDKTNRYVYLYKSVNGTDTELAKSAEPIYSEIWKDYRTTGVKIRIVVGLESIDVYIDDTNVLSCPNVYDSSIEKGKIAFSNRYQVYKLFDFNIETHPTTAQAGDFILNRTFTSADTEEALEAEGWDVTMHSNTITADALGASEIAYDAEISGNVTVEVKASKQWNDSYIYLRYDNETKNGYAVRSRLASDQYISFGKVIGGVYNEIKKITPEKTLYDTTDTKYKVSIADEGDDVKLVFNIVYGNSNTEWKWKDEKSDNNEPIKTAGGIVFKGGDTAKSYISYIKAYPTMMGERTIADTKIRYYINNQLADELSEGTAYVNMPIAVLGEKFIVIVALHDNDAVKQVKIIDVEDAYNMSGAELFDTTGVSENAYIATYIWSGFDTMEALTVPAVLD